MVLQIQCAWNAFRFLDWVFNPFHECPSILERSKFGKILFKDKLPHDKEYLWKFHMYLFIRYYILLKSHHDIIRKFRRLTLNISIVRFMTIYIFIFLQFELCNKILKSLIQILTLSRHNVFYFLSGWKCVLFILIRQIL